MEDVELKAGEREAEENCESPRSPSIRSLDLTKDTLIFEPLFYMLKDKLPVGVGEVAVEGMELGASNQSVEQKQPPSQRSFKFLLAKVAPLQVGYSKSPVAASLHAHPAGRPDRPPPGRALRWAVPGRSSGSYAAAAAAVPEGLAGGGERLCPSLCPIRECGLCPEPGSNA